MKRTSTVLSKAMLIGCLSLGVPALGAPESHESDTDKTLSPYFFVQGGDGSVDALPLKSTRADVTVSGVIADVQVTQVYKNEGQKTLEAIYIFPASTRAAVYAMKMTLGERTIVANIQEKQKAREQYEKALAEGKTASLLEQQRPNVFQMNVGNILPGDEIKVVLNYTEALVPEDGVYEFVYPAVVGPRYSNRPAATAAPSEKWVANPYLHAGETSPFSFGFTLNLHAGMPIAKITSPSHELDTRYTDPQTAQVILPESKTAGNRDVVVRYALAGDKIESGVLLNRGEKENFFLLMLEPPKRVAAKSIVPREYIFVVDVSGSMHGFPLDVTKALMKNLLGNLRPTDFFNVMCFSGGNATLSPVSLPATPANLQKAIATLDHEEGGGGTELMPALRAAMALPRAESNVSRSMIVVTDGYVDVEKDAFEYVRTHLDHGNVFAFGIGSSVNRYLMEGLAHAGMGEPFIVLNQDQAAAKAQAFKTYIDSPVLTDIRVRFDGLNAYDVEPATIPDLFAQKPVVVFGKYKGAARGKIIITGQTSAGEYRQEVAVQGSETANPALKYLWARERIRLLADINKLEASDKRVKEVTQLGLDYNLLTDYTSFIAIDSLKRTDGKNRTTVNQPLPLPEGVSDLAVGGAAQSQAYSPAMICKRACEAPAPSGYATRGGEADELESAKAEEKKDKAGAKSPLSAELQLRVIKGSLTSAQVLQTLSALKPGWLQLAQSHGKAGVLLLNLHIDAQGKLIKIETVQDTLGLADLNTKIERETRQITFAQESIGMVIRVEIRMK